MYVHRNIQSCSCNYCYSGKKTPVAYSESVCSFSYPARNALAPYYIVIGGLSACTIFFTLSHTRHCCRKNVMEHKMCCDFLYNFVQSVSHSKKNSRRCHKCLFIRLHVKCPLFFSDFNEICYLLNIFSKNRNIKFHENSSSGCRVVPCGQTDRNRRT